MRHTLTWCTTMLGEKGRSYIHMDISHLYGNALCFAPKHLVVESRSANTLRANVLVVA
jgi:hypothetical protein